MELAVLGCFAAAWFIAQYGDECAEVGDKGKKLLKNHLYHGLGLHKVFGE